MDQLRRRSHLGVAARPLVACAGTVLVAACFAPPTHAATTLSRSGNVITLAGDDAADRISGAGGDSTRKVTFYAPTGSTLTPGPGCRREPGRDRGGHRVLSCGAIARPANPLTLRATLGGGDDILQLAWDTDRHPRLIADGGEGNDEINGTQLADDIQGGPGNDTLSGSQDRDGLKGGPGDDTLFGGADSDALFGEQGRDKLYGDGVEGAADGGGTYAGLDVIDATDFPTDVRGFTAEQILAIGPEADEVSCGPGDQDGATVDASDVVAASCELVTGGGRVPPILDTTPRFPATLTATPRSRYSKATTIHGEPIRLVASSSAGGFVTAKLEISAADRRRFRVPGGRIIAATTTTAVTPQLPVELFMRLNWSQRAALAEMRQIRATLTLTATHGDPSGSLMQTTTTTASIVIR